MSELAGQPHARAADEVRLIEVIERHCDEHPHALALVDDDRRWTFAELDAAVNRIAWAVLAADPDGHCPYVCLVLGHGAQAVMAALAIPKLGRAAVPLDAEAPPARVEAIVSRVLPAVVLYDTSTKALADVLSSPEIIAIDLDAIGDDVPTTRPACAFDPDGAAVVMFTSGSTGEPKGVVRRYRGQLAGLTERLADPVLTPARRFALTQDIHWAGGWINIANMLSTGCSLHLYDLRHRGVTDLAAWLRHERIELVSGPPSMLQSMLDAGVPVGGLPDLTMVSCMGEVLHRGLVERFFEVMPSDAVVENVYGSSEMGGVARLRIDRSMQFDTDVVPVGRPRSIVEVSIASPDPTGAGEIVVSGERVAVGYLGDEALDPAFTRSADGRIYTFVSGDLGRLRPDGLLEYLGRLDHRLKVRGHRIDPLEIERELLRMPGIEEAAVGVAHRGGRPCLVAWLVGADGAHQPTVVSMRRSLRDQLPGYMIPAAAVVMDALPRSSRGKLRRDELPEPAPGRPELDVPYREPIGHEETVVAEAFASVLDVAPVGRDDDFFDLGGDSLAASEVMTMLSASLGRDLPLAEFIDAATPAAMARRIDVLADGGHVRLVSLADQVPGPMLFCVHGGGGQVLSYAALATRMAEDFRVIGVQMSTTDRARDLFSVRRLARRYAEEIRAMAPTEPFVVAGHSFGGQIAFELARQLFEEGQPVRACVLIDAPVPTPRVFTRKMSAEVSGVPDSGRRGDGLREVGYAAHALTGRRPAPHRLLTERMISAKVGTGLFRPRRLRVAVVAISADQSAVVEPMARWAQHAGAGFQLIAMPGDHQSILMPPLVDELARHLRTALA